MSIRQSSLAASEIHKSIGQKITLTFTATTDPKPIKNNKISLIAKAKGVPIRVIGFGDEYLPSTKFKATGRILVMVILEVQLVQLRWLLLMKILFMWGKVKIPCGGMYQRDWGVFGKV